MCFYPFLPCDLGHAYHKLRISCFDLRISFVSFLLEVLFPWLILVICFIFYLIVENLVIVENVVFISLAYISDFFTTLAYY